MAAKRGRKMNDSLPPDHRRDLQRAFRARRAAHLKAVEDRLFELEDENLYLRKALHLPPPTREPLGCGPTGRDKPLPRAVLAVDFFQKNQPLVESSSLPTTSSSSASPLVCNPSIQSPQACTDMNDSRENGLCTSLQKPSADRNGSTMHLRSELETALSFKPESSKPPFLSTPPPVPGQQRGQLSLPSPTFSIPPPTYGSIDDTPMAQDYDVAVDSNLQSLSQSSQGSLDFRFGADPTCLDQAAQYASHSASPAHNPTFLSIQANRMYHAHCVWQMRTICSCSETRHEL